MYFWLRCFAFRFVLLFMILIALRDGLAQTPALTAPQALTIHPGDSSVPLTVTLGTSTSSAALSVVLTGLPSGVTAAPLTMTPGSTATLLVSASPSAGIELFTPHTAADANTATVPARVLAFGGGVQAVAPIALTISLTNPAFAPAASAINLPVVSIDTSGVGINDKVTDVPGTITIRSADGQTTYLPSSKLPDDTATFHIHGNSTALMPKKPYKVKLNTGADLLAAMGLSCGYVNSSGAPTCDKSKDFILLANYDDKTLLRDWSASALANSIPSGGSYLSYPAAAPTPTNNSTVTWWAPHSVFVELYLNGAYQGNYQLIEEVDVDTHRINIPIIGDATISGKTLTGGYLGEIDKELGEDFYFTTTAGVSVGLDDPHFTPEVPEQTQYFQNFVQSAENSLFAANYTDPSQGWRAHFDETTAINFYIVNDLMGNVDGGDFYSSDYFYKNENDPLLYMGPVWDFDISSGNVYYVPISNPTVPWMQVGAPWYQRWFTDPGFHADVVKQWNALKNGGVFSQWLSSIPAQAATLQQSQLNNFNRWPMQGVLVWPNPQAAGSYNGEVNYLTQWLTLRMAYLDGVLNSKAATVTVLTPPAATLRAGEVMSFTASAASQGPASQVPTGTISLFSNSLLLAAASVNSAGVANISVQNIPAGAVQLQAVYSGDSTFALSASSPVPVTVAAPLISTAANLQSSTADALTGSQVVLTASVVGNQGGAVPTGTFTFSSNGAVLGTQAISSIGVASLSLTNLSAGANLIQASYSGDQANGAAVSNTVSVMIEKPIAAAPVFAPAGGTFSAPQTVTVTSPAGTSIYYTTDGSTPTTASTVYSGPITVSLSETIQAIAAGPLVRSSPVASASFVIVPTFTMSATPASLTAISGQPVTATVQVTPLYGFHQTVTLGCTAVPAVASCTFAPPSVTPSGAPVSSTVAITFPSLSARGMPLRPKRGSEVWSAGLFCFSPLLLLLGRRRLRTCRWARVLALVFAGLCIAGLNGCGSGGPKPLETVTITATGGPVTTSAQITVQLQ